MNEQLEQIMILTEDAGVKPKQMVVDLGFLGVDAANPGVEIMYRCKFKSLTERQRRWLKCRQAVELAIGRLKHDNAMDRCWLQGATGGALHAVLCAALQHLPVAVGCRALGAQGSFRAPARAARNVGCCAGRGPGSEKRRRRSVGLAGRVNFAWATQYSPATANPPSSTLRSNFSPTRTC